MDVPKTIFFLLISLISMSDSVESRVREAQKDGVKGPKEEMREKITLIKRFLDEVLALAEICGAGDSQPCLNGGSCIDEANALGMESGKIKDDQITSSTNEAERQASRGRLNFEVYPGKPGSWSSRVKNNDQWLQVDLGNGNGKMCGIVTQGGTNYRGKARWVEKYRLAFSDDGVNFHYYKGGEATAKVFVGNKDRDTVVYNELSQPITSRYIRIRPIPIGNRRKVFAMRVELYGCQEIKPCDSSPCINGGNCTNEADGKFTCDCPSGWTGDTCEKQLAKGLSNSNIIGDNQNYLVMLSRWLRPVAQSNGQWILCWRASLHGWAAKTFRSLCGNKGPTVTIVKDFHHNIFGGYTSISWRGGSGYRNDPKAFLFSLKNPTNNPRKLFQLDSISPYSLYEQANFGPSFGSENDLNIVEYANMHSNSYEKLGHTYTVPSGIPGDTFLTGHTYFRANEIETFYERAE